MRDGDTMVVRDGNVKTVLRLAEVDALERTQLLFAGQPAQSRRAMQRQGDRVQPVSVDRFGRTVAMLRYDGVVVNWRQVQDGMAWCFLKYLTRPATCLPLEREAMNARRGLWRDDMPLAPWEFRAAKAQPVAP